MAIHALRTGMVQIKTTMARGEGAGPLRPLRLLTGGEFTAQLPLHAWLIEHREGPILVDTGELSSTANLPFARFAVEREDEIDRQLAAHGLAPTDLGQVVLTHLHGDHIDGLARLRGARVRASEQALRRQIALRRRHVRASAIELRDEPFGAFARSAPLTADGRVVAVATPGHARGHISVVVVEEDRHVLLAGDCAYSERQLLEGWVDGVSLSVRTALSTLSTVRDHARAHPTVFLPSHDPDSARRLAERTTLAL